MSNHLLGPHVVGTRVVVRRVVAGETGPTGGPAFTDILGVCTSWADGVATISRDSGEVVRVPVTEIVSGKPVPPRPSVRLRVSPRDAELHTASLVDGVVTEWLGEWQLNHEPDPGARVRGRFNSCLAMGSPGMPLAEAFAQVAAYFDGLGVPPMLRVEDDSDAAAAVGAVGWEHVVEKDSALLLTATAQLARRLRGRPEPVGLEPQLSVEGTKVRVDLDDVAHGEAGLDGDWLGVHGVRVDRAHRRRGLAKAVMRELVAWGAERGARTVWLHVETSNAPALALYDSLGFAEHHRMAYYARPRSADEAPAGSP